MKALKTIGIIAGILIVLLTLLGLFAPTDLQVEQQMHLKASKGTVWKYLINLENRDKWSPWRDYDPAMQLSYAGPASGVGAISRWQGEEVGIGEQEIVSVEGMQKIETKIRFREPMNGEMDTWFELDEAKEGGCSLKWGAYTKMGFPWNVLGLFMGMRKATARDFENGLGKLKKVVEEEARNTWGLEVQEIEYPGAIFIGKRGIVRFDEMQEFYGTHLSAIKKLIPESGAEVAGMPAGLYYKWDDNSASTDLAAAIPVTKSVQINGYETITIPANKALLIDYYGDYANLGQAHWAMDDYIALNGLRQVTPMIEQYVSDPGLEPDPNKWLTKVYYLIE